MGKVFNDVMSVQFKAQFKGNGCVNYDSKDQTFVLSALKIGGGGIHSNVKLSKKVFRKSGDNYVFNHVVSADCIRHEMFKAEQEFYNSGVAAFPKHLSENYAKPTSLLRGYMNASSSVTTKKKSALTITDAVEINKDGHSYVQTEVHSCSGSRVTDEKTILKSYNSDIKFTEKKGETNDSSKENNDDKGSTSLFYEEVVPSCEYESCGSIDLTELQFISLSSNFDRNAVADAYRSVFIQKLNENFGEEHSIKPYYIKNSFAEDTCYEDGVLLSQNSVDGIVKEGIKRIMSVNIVRKKAMFVFDSIELYVCTANGKKEKIEINSIEELNDYQFNYKTKYEIVSEEKIIEMQAEALKYAKQVEEAEKAKKSSSRSKKNSNKEEEESANEE